MKLIKKLLNKEKNNEKNNRIIKVRFPSMAGDEDRSMTIQELQQEYKNYLIIDPKVGEQVDMKKLADLDIQEVVAMPPISGG